MQLSFSDEHVPLSCGLTMECPPWAWGFRGRKGGGKRGEREERKAKRGKGRKEGRKGGERGERQCVL